MEDQHSALPVKLSDLIEGLELQADESFSYLNTTTGEVVSVTTEELRAAEAEKPLADFPAWQHDAIRIAGEILATDYYLLLPTKLDIHEYSIMERFCYSIDDDDIGDDLWRALRGRGAFRYFINKIREHGLAQAWYQYRDAALQEIAIAWCAEHGIRYTET